MTRPINAIARDIRADWEAMAPTAVAWKQALRANDLDELRVGRIGGVDVLDDLIKDPIADLLGDNQPPRAAIDHGDILKAIASEIGGEDQAAA